MKRSTLKFFLSMAAITGLALSASADLLYTFDTGLPTTGGMFTGGAVGWSSTYSAAQALDTAGGWTPGGAGSPKFEFTWPDQSTMAGIANYASYYQFSVDLSVNMDSLSYVSGAQTWYQLFVVGNSDGVGGWSQNQVGGGLNYIDQGQTPYSLHVVMPLTQLGFNPGDSWFQVFFGANSGGGEPIQFFIDNIHVAPIPEPASLALVGLGAAALMIFRRR